MPEWKLNIFVRVVTRRAETEGKTVDEILDSYPLLTNEEKETIKARINAQ